MGGYLIFVLYYSLTFRAFFFFRCYFFVNMVASIHRMYSGYVFFFVKNMRQRITGYRHSAAHQHGAVKQ